MTACLALLAAMIFCQPSETFAVHDYVDTGVGLYMRQYVVEGKEIIVSYQLAPVDLKDEWIDTMANPFMVSINRTPYRVDCEDKHCRLTVY